MKSKFFSKLIHKTIIPQVLFGILTGIITGFMVYFYNYLIHKAVDWSAWIYSAVKINPAYIPLLIVCVAAISLGLGYLIKFLPEIRGSGVPYSEGIVRGKLRPRWYYALPAMFFASIMSIFMGLSLGSEGPSIFLGCLTGYGIANLLKMRCMNQRLLATAGACSGLAVAFNAPFAGILFSVEEAHRRTSPQIIIPAISSVISSVLIINYIFGNNIFLNYTGLTLPVTVENIIGGAVIGIIAGLLAMLFNFCITKKIKPWEKIPVQFRILIPAAFCIICAFLLPDATGSGGSILTGIATYGTGMLALIFLVKYLLTILSNKSGAPGGVFIPVLALGALAGAFVSKVMTAMHIENSLIYLSLMGAAAFFAASVRAPFTAAVLIFEITGYSLNSVIGIMVAVGASYLIAELFKSKPLYEEVLEGILHANNISDAEMPMREFSVIVEKGSVAVDLTIHDLILPDNTLIVRISRGDFVFVPDGETIIKEKDSIIIACENDKIVSVEEEIFRMFAEDTYKLKYKKA